MANSINIFKCIYYAHTINVLIYTCDLLQIGLDTYYWNPIQHVFVWGSILAWFVVLPITSSPGFYIGGIGVFRFDFVGVFYEVIQTATFWFYLPLAAIIALGPTITFRTLLLDLRPTLVDDVRLKMKKEGRRAFRRALLKTKLPGINITLGSVKERTGYAFSHQGGFGKLILSGKMFSGQSEEQVHKERERRISSIYPSAESRAEGFKQHPDPTTEPGALLEPPKGFTASGQPTNTPTHMPTLDTLTADNLLQIEQAQKKEPAADTRLVVSIEQYPVMSM